MSEGESSNVFPVKPQRLIRDLRDACDKNAVVCVDTGAVKYLMTRYWKIYARRTFFLSNGLASMGFAVPAAIAGKIVFPERQVLAVVGDGGLQMSLSDFKTISENNLDITIVVFDNSGYGILAAKQQDLNVDIFGTRFGNPDFCKIAEASGIKAYSVQKANDVLPTIQEALTDGRASLVHVPVERNEARLMGL
jgi:acetolactate synthase-1/2/3 large subunit